MTVNITGFHILHRVLNSLARTAMISVCLVEYIIVLEVEEFMARYKSDFMGTINVDIVTRPLQT